MKNKEKKKVLKEGNVSMNVFLKYLPMMLLMTSIAKGATLNKDEKLLRMLDVVAHRNPNIQQTQQLMRTQLGYRTALRAEVMKWLNGIKNDIAGEAQKLRTYLNNSLGIFYLNNEINSITIQNKDADNKIFDAFFDENITNANLFFQYNAHQQIEVNQNQAGYLAWYFVCKNLNFGPSLSGATQVGVLTFELEKWLENQLPG